MVIQWFPGHMHKALKLMENELKIVDIIIYVLDSRAPFSCSNPKLNELAKDKQVVYIFNKSDLADNKKVDEWISFFSKKGKCIKINSIQSGTGKKVEEAIATAASAKVERLKNKNVNATLRGMVIGVPNCGKSTLINNLTNKGKTQTGNKPGVTRGKQWIKLPSGIEVVDTPGTLWPAFTNSKVAKHLAYIGSIKDEVLDIYTLSLEFLTDINIMYPGILENKYKITISPEDMSLDILGKICKSRGFLLKKGELDYERGSYAVITDFRQGKLGRITLDDVKQMDSLAVKDNIREKYEER